MTAVTATTRPTGTDHALIAGAEEIVGVESLASISLEQILQQAALMTRVDRKYVIPVASLGPLMRRLRSDAAVLEIDGARRFAYRSTYWDTPELAAFTMAGQGRRRRFKVRTRTYLNSGDSFLEVKTRGPRGTSVKVRMPYAGDGAVLEPAAQDFVLGALADAGVDGVDAAGLRPMLLTTYLRTTLIAADGHGTPTRATIDTALAWHSADAAASLDMPDLAIVETKGTSTPSSVDRALWRLQHRPIRVSKYGTGMAALHADLPNLKWHNVLRRHLDH